jgi:hypothetical protein
MVIYYIYKIHFLCGFPSSRYYIGKHKHTGSLSNDKYTGSGNFCKAYFKKYGKKEGITYIKEILEINPSEEINNKREEALVEDKYKTDPLCMNLIPGGSGIIPTGELSKVVVQYDYYGNFIKEYPSQIAAATAINLKDSTAISKCCITKQGSAGGFVWRFKGDLAPTIDDINAHSIPILQYDKKGNVITSFSSITEASSITGICADSISGCCSHKRKSGGGYIWRKFNDPLNKSKIKIDNFWGKRKIKQFTSKGEYIKTFNSLKEASVAVNAPWQAIQRVCKGKRKTTHGYIWKYSYEED